MLETSYDTPAYPAYQQAGAGRDFKKITEIFKRVIHPCNRYFIFQSEGSNIFRIFGSYPLTL
jgi:hypothetical protein